MDLGPIFASGIFATALPTFLGILMAYIVLCPIISLMLLLAGAIEGRTALAFFTSTIVVLALLFLLWGFVAGIFNVQIGLPVPPAVGWW